VDGARCAKAEAEVRLLGHAFSFAPPTATMSPSSGAGELDEPAGTIGAKFEVPCANCTTGWQKDGGENFGHGTSRCCEKRKKAVVVPSEAVHWEGEWPRRLQFAIRISSGRRYEVTSTSRISPFGRVKERRIRRRSSSVSCRAK